MPDTYNPSATALGLWGEKISKINKDWLGQFYASYPAHVPDDDLATNFLSCGAILLTSAVLGYRVRKLLAEFTELPIGFVQAACDAIELHDFWDVEEMRDLVEALWDDEDFAPIEAALRSVMEGFAHSVWDTALAVELQGLRNNKLVGGRDQDWEDPTFAEEYGVATSVAG